MFKDEPQQVPEDQENHEQKQDYVYIYKGKNKNIAADRKGNFPDLKDHSFEVGQNRDEDKADNNCIACPPFPYLVRFNSHKARFSVSSCHLVSKSQREINGIK